MNSDPESSVRLAFRANAVFSGLSCVVLLAGAGFLAPVLGVDALLLRIVGAGLGVFALDVWRLAGKRPLRRAKAWSVVVADVLWVLGSVGLLLLAPEVLTASGRLVVAAVGVVVAGLAVAQARGLAGRSSVAVPDASA